MDLASSSSSESLFQTNTSHPPVPQMHVQFSYGNNRSKVEPSSQISASTMPCPMFSLEPKRGTHRRAQSDFQFRFPGHDLLLDDEIVSDNIEATHIWNETGEDLVSAYLEKENSMEIETSGPALPPMMNSFSHSRSPSTDETLFGMPSIAESRLDRSHGQRPRHYHSLSMDGSTSLLQEFLMGELDLSDTKKPMTADKGTELSSLDPKRAKRILANRQSAARSKERKLRYVADLEQKVQALQTEATSLSAQLAILQRDAKNLSTENNELKLRLNAMEQQAKLHDALNETLKDEVKWLKSARMQMGDGSFLTVNATQPGGSALVNTGNTGHG